MSFFNFRTNPDRQLLQHPLLRGKKMLGKGQMGGTFECDATSVYKVTCDIAQYRFLEEVEPHWFFPRFIEGFGCIAEDVYLLRCERLAKYVKPAPNQDKCHRGKPNVDETYESNENFVEEKTAWQPERDAARDGWRSWPLMIKNEYNIAFKENLTEPWCAEAECLEQLASMSTFAPLSDALLSLSSFIQKTGYRLDCHPNNFMMRGSQFVFNDPVTQLFRRHEPDANYDFISSPCADVSA